MKSLVIVKDAMGHMVEGINYSSHIDYRVLAANVAESHVVPARAKYVLFSADADFYAKLGGAATVPAADILDGSGPMMNPTLRSLDGSTTIGLISPTVCLVQMEFYS